MAKKIIVFLSDYKSPKKGKFNSHKNHEKTIKPKNPTHVSKGRVQNYKCPDGSYVKGTQTNEAPLLYLLKKHPDVSEILCIVTTRAERTFEYLGSVLNKEGFSGVEKTKISYESNKNFIDILLSKDEKTEKCVVAEKKKEYVVPGDEIFLETTGGFRNTIMELLLLSRALSYAGIKTVGAVYSNFGKKEIEDITHMIRFFDLIGGMQEMMSFGNVSTLRQYYGTSPDDEKIEALLTALEELSESIMLCRTKQIGERLETFNTAMKDAENCEDPMMRALLPAFSKKYGEKMDTPALIRWCIDSDMLQQALTIYTERIPAYLFEDVKYITKQPRTFVPDVKSYEDASAIQLYKGLLTLSEPWKCIRTEKDENDKLFKRQKATLEHFEKIEDKRYYTYVYPTEQLKLVCMDYLFIKMIRNKINHATESMGKGQDIIAEYLNSQEDEENKYPLFKKEKNQDDKVNENEKVNRELGFRDLKNALEQGLKNLELTPEELKKQ